MKLTQEQADDLILKAYTLVGEHYRAKYRLGQAIWNLLPKETSDPFHGTSHDFFYWEDDSKVLEVFLEHYVGTEE